MIREIKYMQNIGPKTESTICDELGISQLPGLYNQRFIGYESEVNTRLNRFYQEMKRRNGKHFRILTTDTRHYRNGQVELQIRYEINLD